MQHSSSHLQVLMYLQEHLYVIIGQILGQELEGTMFEGEIDGDTFIISDDKNKKNSNLHWNRYSFQIFH